MIGTISQIIRPRVPGFGGPQLSVEQTKPILFTAPAGLQFQCGRYVFDIAKKILVQI